MGCEPYLMNDGTTLIICSRGRQERKKCAFCGRTANYYCDYPVGGGETCDKPLCKKCRELVGEELDYCPKHAKKAGLFGDEQAIQYER